MRLPLLMYCPGGPPSHGRAGRWNAGEQPTAYKGSRRSVVGQTDAVLDKAPHVGVRVPFLALGRGVLPVDLLRELFGVLVPAPHLVRKHQLRFVIGDGRQVPPVRFDELRVSPQLGRGRSAFSAE